MVFLYLWRINMAVCMCMRTFPDRQMAVSVSKASYSALRSSHYRYELLVLRVEEAYNFPDAGNYSC
jgi:hypothetical protein